MLEINKERVVALRWERAALIRDWVHHKTVSSSFDREPTAFNALSRLYESYMSWFWIPVRTHPAAFYFILNITVEGSLRVGFNWKGCVGEY